MTTATTQPDRGRVAPVVTLAERLARETAHTAPLDRDGQPIYSRADDDANLLDASRMTGRTLWNAGDARHVFALDQLADAMLRDDALHASGATDVLASAFDASDPKARKRRAAQVAHLVRDELATHGIAVDITGLRPSRRVGSGRSARAIPGGYVERQYSQVVSAPRVTRKQIASMTREDLAVLDADGSYCHDARHTSDLGEFLSATSIDPRRFAPTHERKSHGARLDWEPRLRVRSPRRVKESTITKLAGAPSWRKPHVHNGETHHVADRVFYVWPEDRPVRRGDRPNYVTVLATVTELPGPWIDPEHVTYGHRTVYVPRKSPARGKRNRSEALAPPATIDQVRSAVTRVQTSRKPESLTVLGRTVVIEPAQRGTVRWQTSSKTGQGKSPASVAGRIIASVSR